MLPLDTTPEAAAVQMDAYRRMGPAGRLKVALELSDFVRMLAIAGIRRRQPECTREQAVEALARQLYGQPDRRED